VKEISRMRLGVLRELKNVRKFFDNMERRVKSREPESIQKAYMFLQTLVVMMDIGELSPDQVALNLELQRVLEEQNERENGEIERQTGEDSKDIE